MTVVASSSILPRVRLHAEGRNVRADLREIEMGGLSDIYNLCWNGGIYICTAVAFDRFAPLVAVPMDVEERKQELLVCRKDCSRPTRLFMAVAREVMGGGK